MQPLTLASIGRFVWTKHTFTNKRMILDFNSPIRSAPRNRSLHSHREQGGTHPNGVANQMQAAHQRKCCHVSGCSMHCMRSIRTAVQSDSSLISYANCSCDIELQ
jgi:hypothetical protein